MKVTAKQLLPSTALSKVDGLRTRAVWLPGLAWSEGTGSPLHSMKGRGLCETHWGKLEGM